MSKLSQVSKFPPHHATHLFGWTREAKFRSLADIFSPFGKGGSRGICLSGGEVFVAAQQRCFGTIEQCKCNKSPLTPLSQRGVKKKLQGFEWSRKIYGVLCTCRVRTTLMGNDQFAKGGDNFVGHLEMCSELCKLHTFSFRRRANPLTSHSQQP